MENINHFKAMLMLIVGAIGGFVTNFLGGWSEDLNTLLICMGIDFVMGILIAALWKKSTKSESGALGSLAMWKGLCRKGGTLLVVLIAYRLDITLGTNYIRTAVIIAFIVNELVSIVENMGIMGIPMPSVIIKAIDVLKKKEE